MISRIVLLTVVVLAAMTSFAFSQKTLEDCGSIIPPCSSWSEWHQRVFELEDFECTITLEYRWCWDPVTQTRYFQYRSIAVNGNCSFMEDFNIYHYSFSGINELIDMLMIQDHENDGYILNCPESYQLVKSYTASCGIWIKCTYELDPNVQGQCDCGWQGPPPDYEEVGIHKVDVWKWQECGNTCCEKTYQVCKQYNSTHDENRVIIQAVSKRRVGNCSGNESGPCLNGQYDKICEDGC